MYDLGVLKSFQSTIPVIAVGNLNTGGTGKTPMVEKLIEMQFGQSEIALISRGYGRRTKGLREVNVNDLPAQSGDEPIQIKKKFPDVHVLVDEKRVRAIQYVQETYPNTGLIILDDAFQHRSVKATINIVLTSFNGIFYNDYLLPVGNLREFRRNVNRADILVVTKVPIDINPDYRNEMMSKISKYFLKDVFFSGLKYGEEIFPKSYNEPLNKNTSVVLVTGIANPSSLLLYLNVRAQSVVHLKYPDHHQFNSNDVENIVKAYSDVLNEGKVLVTTEKDWTRLREFEVQLKEVNLLIIPVKISFGNEDQLFSKTISDKITNRYSTVNG